MKKNAVVHLIFVILFLFRGMVYAVDKPYDADIIVAADGSGDFTSLQPAIDAVPSNEETRTVIYVKRGLYNTEKLIIPNDKINVSIIGESQEETILSYHIYDCSQGKCPTDDAALWTGENIRTSATLTIMGKGFRAENLTIENTAGPVGQALAITVRADKVVFINVNFTSYQDTIYLWDAGNRVYFENCLVVGRTDYIYGGAIAFFQGCEIRSWGGGWITAPSTPQDQDYGFVFNECDITYALNSPRVGDDGATLGLGRPWHNFPKVAWLYCEMTDMINPLGWPTTWNMDYAATSADLHLYEYGNTGGGADMSGRADWAGIRELTSEEAANYTVQKVMAGSDAWDPSAEAPAVTNYQWTGGGASTGWLEKDNWNPIDTPMVGETANVDGLFTITADGSSFEADLNLMNGASLEIASSSAFTFMTVRKASLTTAQDVALDGKIKTKDSLTLDVSGNLLLNAEILGVHKLIKSGAGAVILNTANTGFTGEWIVQAGSLSAAVADALGTAGLTVETGATLIVGNESAFFPKSPLYVTSGASLEMNADIVISEFYIDGSIQAIGAYNAISHPGLISGTGKIIVGRPSFFTFNGGNWDEAANFVPAILPEQGEIVYCEKEIETTSTVFTADLYVLPGGNVRLRGAHRCTGEIHFSDNTAINYNTGGSGFTLHAPIFVDGGLKLNMESGNTAGSIMNLSGPFHGTETVYVVNNGKGTLNTGTLLLEGDNREFNGVWDVTLESSKYPGEPYVTAIDAAGAHALGSGKVMLGKVHRLILNHAFCAGEKLDVSIQESASIVLNKEITVKEFLLNDVSQDNGVYDAGSHAEIFEGSGSLVVNSDLALPAAPSGLSATEILHDQVTVGWTGSSEAGVEYIVFLDGKKEETRGENVATITGLDAETNYSIGVCATNVLGNSDTIFIEITTLEALGTDLHEKMGYVLTPNPVTDMLHLKGSRIKNWEVLSLNGRMISSGNTTGIDVSELVPGLYFVKISTAENSYKYLKFIKVQGR